MISSESSDEELFQPAAKVATAARKPKRVKLKLLASAPALPPSSDGMTSRKRRSETAVESVFTDPEMAQKLKREARKKRKVEEKEAREAEQKQQQKEQSDTERAVKGRAFTLSLAIPGSILDNAQTKELKTYVAGQVARAAVIFQVDEIVVFDDQLGTKGRTTGVPVPRSHDCHVFMARILQYLETPQYLRRALFPMHSDLSCAGLLNPLDCPHHLRAQEWSVYREGVVTDRPLKEKEGSHVYVGLQREVVVDKRVKPGIRVTVKINEASKEFKKKMTGKLVSSAEPREQLGMYWGYTTRFASSLSNVWTDCPFPGGYDLKVGTSERGNVSVDDADFALPKFRHALIVFGGVAGIEECVDVDEKIPLTGADSSTLFDMWVNTCPDQGSRTIRLEEALLVSLAAFRPHIARGGRA
uniref:Methyltransferase n=1 Tax=Hyaloperonospora arabidopsidis (strain Emoy2) TaxID=559515 RepID=M4BVW2_HYAAE